MGVEQSEQPGGVRVGGQLVHWVGVKAHAAVVAEAERAVGMPADVTWHHAALTPDELAAVRSIDYDYVWAAGDVPGGRGPW